MTAHIIDGKTLARDVRADLALAAERFSEQHGRKPGLDVVLIGDNPASQVYVRNKEVAARHTGFRGNVHRWSAQVSEEEVLRIVGELNNDKLVDGILVQLPLPAHLDAARILRMLDPLKDVDGLHPLNVGLLMRGELGLRPCTPQGCMALLDSLGCDLTGKQALVVGRSNLVGKPVALMLLERHATVSIAHSRTRNLSEHVSRADVVIAAVGIAEMIKGAWIKPGAIVLDVGINRDAQGRLVGDVEFDEAKMRAAFITPVPGGVGPMTIAMLLANTLKAAQARLDQSG
ncbi:MAG: bifunctional methylenetetrahydrofolate dehydrogenase/methenyltetrahydrofolate cyclohydrolase FolD [Myxococcales bacterium]|nr:bifunctional methylenetetrahydrofolate dehydrogenase/methenyltetrahydrofolate cyclohydrolase FolD [Myxococcales bacterium]